MVTRGAARDCPDCGASGTVWTGVCDVCLADLEERRWAGRRVVAPAVALAPEALCFSDVVAELSAMVELARDGGDEFSVAAAGERAGRLLGSLRTQFMRDLGLAKLGADGAE